MSNYPFSWEISYLAEEYIVIAFCLRLMNKMGENLINFMCYLLVVYQVLPVFSTTTFLWFSLLLLHLHLSTRWFWLWKEDNRNVVGGGGIETWSRSENFLILEEKEGEWGK